MTLPFKPIQDRIIVAKDATERLLASGLVIPHVDDDADRQFADDRDIAAVLGVGPGKLLADGKRRHMSVNVGDRIVFGRNKGQSIRFNEVDYIVLNEGHAIGRMEGGRLEPLGGYIIAKAIACEQVTEAGVIVPEMADDREEADVVAVGPGAILDDGSREIVDIRVYDRILYNPRMAEPFLQDGQEFLALRQDHIVCVSNREMSIAAD